MQMKSKISLHESFTRVSTPNSFKQQCVLSFNLGIDVAFLINATSKNADKAFKLMTRSTKAVIDKYGDANNRYPVLIHGDHSPIKMCSKNDIDNLELKRGTTKIPALHKDLEKAADFLNSSSTKKSKSKVTKCHW